MRISSGMLLGPYEVLAPLGAGAMGEVYRARDTRLKREVAVKVLPAAFSADPDRLRRFEQEALAASALNHPGILTVHDFGMQDGAPYIVSELLEGTTLREKLSGSALPARRTTDYALQIAHGLAAAHEKGIVHRDLKPENIFVTKDGRVKILDFGLAKLTQPEVGGGKETHAPTLPADTEPGVILGTVGYMSPEQVRGMPADRRSDIFSFGAILYEMLSGRRAFHGDSAIEAMTAILKEDPPELSENDKGIAPALERVVRHCLEKSPEERFQSARDIAFALRETETAPSAAASPAEPRRPDVRSRSVFGRLSLGIGALALLVALIVIAAGWLPKRPPGGPEPGSIQSIAVLPLANLSGDPEQEYFADGMTEALIADLAKIEALRVVSRTSVMRYKGVKKPLPEIARELNVDAIVEGSVLRAGEKVRISAQLIHARTDRHLWAESYERDLRDVLALQSEIARAVANGIEVRVTREERGRLSKARPVNPEAYQAYLKGRYYWNKRTEESLQKGIEYFKEAIARDPAYAPAYSGLADSYVVLQVYRILPPDEAHPKARAAAEKALEIDETLAEAHASMAAVLWDELDWEGTEREFRRALELNPSNAQARWWYTEYLSQRGRHGEAIAQAKRAQDLDPLFVTSTVGEVFYLARQYDRAIQELRKAVRLEPDRMMVHLSLGRVYLQKKMPDEAISELETAKSLSGGSVETSAALGYAHAVSGSHDEARKILEELEERSKQGYVSPYDMGILYTGLGQKDQAFAWLRKACQERSGNVGYVKVDPRSDSLRSDPRFADLLRCLRFPLDG